MIHDESSGPPADALERIDGIAAEAIGAVSEMPSAALYTLACEVLHRAAVELERSTGRPYALTIAMAGRLLLNGPETAVSTPRGQG